MMKFLGSLCSAGLAGAARPWSGTEGDQSVRPQDPGAASLHVTVGSLLATTVGTSSSAASFSTWCFVEAHVSGPWRRHLDQAAAALEPYIVVKRQEALAAACLKMQEELNAHKLKNIKRN